MGTCFLQFLASSLSDQRRLRYCRKREAAGAYLLRIRFRARVGRQCAKLHTPCAKKCLSASGEGGVYSLLLISIGLDRRGLMTRIVAGLFESHRVADLVVEHLVQEYGVPRECVRVHGQDAAGAGEARSPQDNDQAASLSDLREGIDQGRLPLPPRSTAAALSPLCQPIGISGSMNSKFAPEQDVRERTRSCQ